MAIQLGDIAHVHLWVDKCQSWRVRLDYVKPFGSKWVDVNESRKFNLVPWKFTPNMAQPPVKLAKLRLTAILKLATEEIFWSLIHVNIAWIDSCMHSQVWDKLTK